MGRRGRALVFAAAAAICAGLAAAATGGAPDGDVERYGALREVVVAIEPLPAGRPLRRAVAAEALEVRRIPARFVAPDALASPAQALGRRPATAIPAGGYLLGSQFAAADAGGAGERAPRLSGDRQPVEIAVEGAAALAAGGSARGRVDVVVTTEPIAGGGAGRTFVAAEDVHLLDLRSVAEGAGEDVLAAPGAGAWVATLALTRDQALRLIHAQSFAREVRLIGA